MRSKALLSATLLLLPLTGGCGADEPLGRASMAIELMGVNPAAVGSVTVFVLGGSGRGCTDIYSGAVDPLSPAAGLVGMKNVAFTGTTASASFGGIPTGNRLFYVEAYSTSNGVGLPLGNGCALARVKQDKTTRVAINSVCARNSNGQCVD